MLETIMLTATLAVMPSDDREWAVNRPDRGAHSLVIQRAAQPPTGWESFEACVIDRESGGNPSVTNHEGSGAAGIYQFMPSWRHGLPYMVRDRLVDFGMNPKTARLVRIYLSKTYRIEHYPAAYQRIGFAEAIDRGGWRHWTGGSGCNSLVPY